MHNSKPKEYTWMRMDLNLLKALYVLVEERNISRAADRFFVTRSAMSKTLKRLRDNLNDPILVKNAGGLVPTPLALKLTESFSSAIDNIEEGLINSVDFNPANTTDKLRIAAPETFAIGVTPRLFPVLHNSAPYLRLESLHLDDNYQEKLREGSLDFAIYFKQEYSDEFIAHSILSTYPAIWCRKDHPLTKIKEVTLDDICLHPKLSFHLPQINVTELLPVLKKMEKLEHDRELFFETSQLLAAMLMMSDSDALMISNDYLFKHRVFNESIVSISLSHIELFKNLRVDFSLIQHERTSKSPLHKWVIQQASEIFD